MNITKAKMISLVSVIAAIGQSYATDWSQYAPGQPVSLSAGDYLVTDQDFDTFNALGTVTLDAADAVLTFALSQEKLLTHPVVGSGKMVKSGSGALALGPMGKVADIGGLYQDYNTGRGIEIAAGTVKLPQGDGKVGFFGPVTMAEDTALFLIDDNTTVVTALNGSGLVTNTSASAIQLLKIGNAPSQAWTKSTYRGVIGGRVSLRCDCETELLDANSTFIGEVMAHRQATGRTDARGMLAVTSFGQKGASSSIGTSSAIDQWHWDVISQYNGGFRYLGTGETTDKRMFAQFTHFDTPLVFDGGPYGGLVLTGDIYVLNDDRSVRYVLTGSNTTSACTLAGTFNSSTAHPAYLTKEGTGIWRINDNASRGFCGPVAVEEGTLQFESIAEVGELSSLGYATMLCNAPANRTGLTTDEARAPYRVDYSILLGGGANPTLEYVGSKSSVTTTRKIALTGDVSRISFAPSASGATSPSVITVAFNPTRTETPAEQRSTVGSLDLSGGVSALGEGSRTLVLDGAASSGSAKIANVSDGDGTVGLRKSGTGTWKIAGSYSATGPIEVSEGRLETAGAPLYRWYRFSVLQTDNSALMYIRQLGLFDENGNGYHPNMTNLCPSEMAGLTDRNYNPGRNGLGEYLKPGECTVGFGNSATFSEFTSRVFEDSTSAFYAWTYRLASETDADSWMKVIFRLPDDAPAIKYYDLCQQNGVGGQGHICKFKLEASVNGTDWVELHKESECKERTRGQWNSTGVAWAANQNCLAEGSAFGYAIAAGPAAHGAAPSLASAVGGVKVAKGATLAAGGASELSSLTVDASAPDGMGVIEGFGFAQTGSLYLLNVPSGAQNRTVPVSFANCTGLENISAWRVYVNGREKKGWTVKANETGVSFSTPGLLLLIR